MSFFINDFSAKNRREECVQIVSRSEAYRENDLLYSLIGREEYVQTATRSEAYRENCLLYSLIEREEYVQTITR